MAMEGMVEPNSILKKEAALDQLDSTQTNESEVLQDTVDSAAPVEAETAEPSVEPTSEPAKQSDDVEMDSNQVQDSIDVASSQIDDSNQHDVQTDQTAIDQQPTDQKDPLLVKDQLKFMSNLIRNMKKKKDAVLFLQPVDPVALNIPTYFTVVQHPMDISTIEKQYSNYEGYEKVKEHLDLMFDNCLLFNGQDSPVSMMAKNLRSWYQKEMLKLPTQVVDKSKKKHVSYVEKPLKREHPSREDSGKRKLLSKKGMAEMKFCNYVHREATRKQNSSFAWPFMQPVDPIALNIPHYRDIIKEPMDLSTIRKKLDLQEYSNAEEFESDFRLMLNNCFTFNSPDQDIYQFGKQLEQLFETKWSEKTNFLAQHGEEQVRSKYDYSDEEDDDEDAQHIEMLKTQIRLLNQQLQVLVDKRKGRKKQRRVSSAVLPSPVGSVAQKSKPKQPKKPSDKKRKRQGGFEEDEKMPEGDITYEQKRELSDNINILPQDYLPQVFEIIKSGNTALNAIEDEEIELDIDSLDKAVLWKLYLFVKRHTRQPKRAKLEDTEMQSGNVSSSSSSDSEDSERDYTETTKKKLPKIKVKHISPQKASKGVKRAPKTSSGKEKVPKKKHSPMQFRMEMGEVTTYASNFKAELVQPKTQIVKEKAKPRYIDVLDNAWEEVAKLATAESIPATLTLEIEPSPKSPESILSDDRINSPIDLQGPSELIREADGDDDMEATHQADRERYAEICLQRLETVGLNEWILNNDRERYGSDEEGAI